VLDRVLVQLLRRAFSLFLYALAEMFLKDS